jgi:hypothetical protein
VSCDDERYGPPEAEFDGLYRGDTHVLPFLAEEMDDPTDDPDDPATVWVARDLSAGVFTCQARVGSEEATSAWATLAVNDSGAATGEFDVTITSTQAALGVPGVDYWADVEYVDGGVTETLVKFRFTFDPDVTRD